jgi:hypothetical protein
MTTTIFLIAAIATFAAIGTIADRRAVRAKIRRRVMSMDW